MTQGGDKKPRKPGYRKPPAERQFKPGQSGNPRGRPTKTERSLTPRQTVRDILAVTEGQTRIRTPDGVRSVSIIEALMLRVVQKALDGHAPSLRFAIKLHERSVREHYDRYEKHFGFLEMVEDDNVVKPVPLENKRSYTAFLNGLRKKTRRI